MLQHRAGVKLHVQHREIQRGFISQADSTGCVELLEDPGMPGNSRNANLFFSGLWFKLLHHPQVRAKQSRPGPWCFLLQSAPKCQLVTALRISRRG